MEHPVFKTFESAEGLLEWAMRVFALTMIVLHGQGLEPSEPAQVVAKTILSANCNTFKELYHNAARSFHPDKNDSDTNADMALINNAYEKRKALGGCQSDKATPVKGRTKTRTKTGTKARGGTKNKNGPKAKGGTKNKNGPKAKGGTKNKSGPKAKGGTKNKNGPKAKGGTKNKSGPKAKGGTKNSLSMGQLVAGIGVGCVVGYTMKECKKIGPLQRTPHPSSPRNRPTSPHNRPTSPDSSDSSDSE